MTSENNARCRTRDLPPIVFAIDDNYCRPLCVVLRSLAAANIDHLDAMTVIVLHDLLSSKAARRLKFHAADVGLSIELRRVHLGSGGPTSKWITRAAYLRLKIAEALPEYDSALYLDSDILIIGDLLPLLRTKLDSTLIAAVRDPLNPVLKYGIGLPGWNELGIDGDREYFNSGVMLLNLRICREQEVLTRSIFFLEANPQHVMFWDQDALNWAVADNWFRLDRHWNTFPISAILKMPGKPNCAEDIMPLDVLVKDERNARILHYAGSRKPWSASFPSCAARDRYVAVLDETDTRESQKKL